ncbi:MAG: hypothetical protein DBX55_01770 [Verrucomicrobia bacterium]|nr:MAG: hypothetical protein DBX55_01770 [Verrucomicrobiota bacterium]
MTGAPQNCEKYCASKGRDGQKAGESKNPPGPSAQSLCGKKRSFRKTAVKFADLHLAQYRAIIFLRFSQQIPPQNVCPINDV